MRIVEHGLLWESKRVIWPVRFTHDRDGFWLLHQPGRRRSRWFERLLYCNQHFHEFYRPMSGIGDDL